MRIIEIINFGETGIEKIELKDKVRRFEDTLRALIDFCCSLFECKNVFSSFFSILFIGTKSCSQILTTLRIYSTFVSIVAGKFGEGARCFITSVSRNSCRGPFYIRLHNYWTKKSTDD